MLPQQIAARCKIGSYINDKKHTNILWSDETRHSARALAALLKLAMRQARRSLWRLQVSKGAEHSNVTCLEDGPQNIDGCERHSVGDVQDIARSGNIDRHWWDLHASLNSAQLALPVEQRLQNGLSSLGQAVHQSYESHRSAGHWQKYDLPKNQVWLSKDGARIQKLVWEPISRLVLMLLHS